MSRRAYVRIYAVERGDAGTYRLSVTFKPAPEAGAQPAPSVPAEAALPAPAPPPLDEATPPR
jgi:hypothetical protein